MLAVDVLRFQVIQTQKFLYFFWTGSLFLNKIVGDGQYKGKENKEDNEFLGSSYM